MAIFETKKVNIDTLPEYLREIRQHQSYGLRHVSKITNISEKFLEYLEEGYYHKLPADVYVYGFLKKLGELYRIDYNLLLDQYKKERGIHDRINKARPDRGFQRPKININPKTLSFALLGLFIVFVLGYLFYQVNAINRPPSIEITSPSDGARIPSSSLVIQGRTAIGATLSIEGKSVLVDSSGNFKQPVSIGPGEKVLTFVATNNFGKQSTKQLLIIGDFENKEAEPPQSEQFALNMLLTVEPNSTWISVKIDGGVEQEESLIAGSTKTYNAKDRIVISTGDAGSTRVRLNGRDFGKLGRDGEVLNDIVFTVDSLNIVR